jgi:tetratricopeptide (TPR) repeat protein
VGAKYAQDSWLYDFSLVLTQSAMGRFRRDPDFEVFAGSKARAALWLAIVAAASGAFGGMLVSGALWRSWLQLPVWLVAFILLCIVVRTATLTLSGAYLAFLSGWCNGWGLLVGACAMWGAQLSSPGWTYGIAGGMGFLIGITAGVYEPEDVEGRDSFFALGMVMAPGAACLAAWLYRNQFEERTTLGASALTGAIAGLVFLGPVMALLFARLKSVEGLKRFASLLLHNGETIAEALSVLDSAIRLAPQDAELIDRRALAMALLGRDDEAETDWARHAQLAPGSPARDISQGWVHMRRERSADAAASFERAAGRRRPNRWALVGLGMARLRQADPRGAISALEAIPGQSHDALSLTWLAEAYLAAGDAKQAAQTATDAIDERDSIHGRTWLVRGDARRAMGDIDGAARDYNKALGADEEMGVEERGLARLETIGRPVVDRESGSDEEDEPDSPGSLPK